MSEDHYALYNITKAPNGVNPNGGPFPGGAAVGQPTPPPSADWKPLDFSWFLGFGVPTNWRRRAAAGVHARRRAAAA